MTDPTPTPATVAARVERVAHLRWVPIAKMKAPPLAQRDLNMSRVDYLAANFDLEQIGNPTVNLRGGTFWVIDGQHRIEALREMGWGDQQIQCWTYTDLTEEQEAERFLKLNDTLTVAAFQKFRIAVHAGREVECDIDRIVRAQGLCVSQEQIDGAIGAVGTLRRIYSRGGPATLARTLRICRDAYGDTGLDAAVLDGIGLLCERYNGELDDAVAVLRLSRAMGGVGGLLGKAERNREKYKQPRAQCVAAAAIEIINAGKGGKKLPGWWRDPA